MFAALPIGSAPYGSAPLASAIAASSWARIAVLSPRDFDAATLAASSQVDSLPIANVQTRPATKVWRSVGTEEYINVTHLSGVASNMLALRHRMSASGIARVWLADTVANTIAAPVLDTGWQSVWPATGKPSLPDWPSWNSAITWANDSLYPCARIGLADPGSDEGFIQVSRMALGRYWQPANDLDFGGVPLGYVPRDVQTETDYSEIFTDRRNISAPRRFQLAIAAGDRDEILSGIDEIQRQRGLWGDVFVFQNLNAGVDFQKLSMQGVFTAPSDHQIVPLFNDNGAMWTAPLAFREV
jgi:hypothetical protein